MDPATRSHGASDEEFADQGEQGSILSQCGSWSSPSITSVDLSELQSLQNPIGVPFETYAQQLGSHLAYDNRRSETLDMFLDLELLSSLIPASNAEVLVDQGPSKHERYELRCEHNRGILAAVDHLFTDADRPQHQGPIRGQRTGRGPTVERQARKQPMRTLEDLEKQSCVEEPGSGDHRRRWITSGRAVCLTILLAAVAWQYYNLVHT
ncbi:MAG: hypothetical protein Q9188_001353 [Gyalolechia gomerana]